MGIVKNGSGQFANGILKLTVSQEWTNGMNWFFACRCEFRKTTSYCNIFWMDVVENGRDQLVYGTLKSAVSWEGVYELSWFLVCWCKKLLSLWHRSLLQLNLVNFKCWSIAVVFVGSLVVAGSVYEIESARPTALLSARVFSSNWIIRFLRISLWS